MSAVREEGGQSKHFADKREGYLQMWTSAFFGARNYSVSAQARGSRASADGRA